MGFRVSSVCLFIIGGCLISVNGFGLSSLTQAVPKVPSVPSIPGAESLNPLNVAQQLTGQAGGPSASPGTCSIAGTSATCTAKVGIPTFNLNADIGIKLGFDITTLKVEVSLLFNGETLFTKDLASGLGGDWCAALPKTMGLLTACVDLYHVDIQPTALSAELCSAVSITRLLNIQFGCVKFDKGMISINNDRSPDKYSVLNVKMNKGNPSISLGKPSLSGMVSSLPFGSSIVNPKPSTNKPLSSLTSLSSVPSLPGVPSLPSVPSLPGVPSLPSVPSLSATKNPAPEAQPKSTVSKLTSSIPIFG